MKVNDYCWDYLNDTNEFQSRNNCLRQFLNASTQTHKKAIISFFVRPAPLHPIYINSNTRTHAQARHLIVT